MAIRIVMSTSRDNFSSDGERHGEAAAPIGSGSAASADCQVRSSHPKYTGSKAPATKPAGEDPAVLALVERQVADRLMIIESWIREELMQAHGCTAMVQPKHVERLRRNVATHAFADPKLVSSMAPNELRLAQKGILSSEATSRIATLEDAVMRMASEVATLKEAGAGSSVLPSLVAQLHAVCADRDDPVSARPAGATEAALQPASSSGDAFVLEPGDGGVDAQSSTSGLEHFGATKRSPLLFNLYEDDDAPVNAGSANQSPEIESLYMQLAEAQSRVEHTAMCAADAEARLANTSLNMVTAAVQTNVQLPLDTYLCIAGSPGDFVVAGLSGIAAALLEQHHACRNLVTELLLPCQAAAEAEDSPALHSADFVIRQCEPFDFEYLGTAQHKFSALLTVCADLLKQGTKDATGMCKGKGKGKRVFAGPHADDADWPHLGGHPDMMAIEVGVPIPPPPPLPAEAGMQVRWRQQLAALVNSDDGYALLSALFEHFDGDVPSVCKSPRWARKLEADTRAKIGELEAIESA